MNNQLIIRALLTAALLLLPEISNARWMKPDTGRFVTMDTQEGRPEEPMSLHKYLYAAANPVTKTDRSGCDAMEDVLSVMTEDFDSLPGAGGPLAGNTCGPDVSAALAATGIDVYSTWFSGSGLISVMARDLQAALSAYSPFKGAANRWWDIQKLNDVGQKDPRVNFGNGSHLGTGPIGMQTVQFTYPGDEPRVYYAGSVNYYLWGLIFRLAFYSFPEAGGNALWSETAAESLAKAHKWYYGYLGTDYEKEAVAFVDYGYSGKNPSNTALPMNSNPGNIASSQRFAWRWPHLHDNLQ